MICYTMILQQYKNIMNNSGNQQKNYQYTFYSSSSPPPSANTYEPSSKGNFTTMFTSQTSHQSTIPEPSYKASSVYSSSYAYSSPSYATSSPPSSEKYNQPLKRAEPYTPPPADPVIDSKFSEKPITFPYKNPGCGIEMTGKSGFKTKGQYATLEIGKVANTRSGGQSGTLQFHLIRMLYFYDGGQGINPDEYTTVCTAQLGQLQGGYSFNDIVRGGMKRTDNSQDHPYRKCYILLLEQYSQGSYKIVDYMNFD